MQFFVLLKEKSQEKCKQSKVCIEKKKNKVNQWLKFMQKFEYVTVHYCYTHTH